jgi:hypothetical protein
LLPIDRLCHLCVYRILHSLLAITKIIMSFQDLLLTIVSKYSILCSYHSHLQTFVKCHSTIERRKRRRGEHIGEVCGEGGEESSTVRRWPIIGSSFRRRWWEQKRSIAKQKNDLIFFLRGFNLLSDISIWLGGIFVNLFFFYIFI